jgi:hypothetical protein
VTDKAYDKETKTTTYTYTAPFWWNHIIFGAIYLLGAWIVMAN